jgi:Lrp/AsnC family transcriptional regulator, regulator for asnA, asnC and gidA
MSPNATKIDEIDNKILHILIEDARTSLKDIAKKCAISSVSVLNRIKRLKKLGVITGATLFASLDTLGFQIVASIGMETDSNTDEILKFFREHTCLIEPSLSIGEYDLSALVYAENISSLNDCVDMVRRRFGIRKVTVTVWSGLPFMNYENIDLRPRNEA